MFVGHFAVALAAKRVAPRSSPGILVAAAQLLDLIWPPLILPGVEHVRIEPGNTAFTPLNFVRYPYSHSLAKAVVWGAIAAISSDDIPVSPRRERSSDSSLLAIGYSISSPTDRTCRRISGRRDYVSESAMGRNLSKIRLVINPNRKPPT